MTVMLDTADVIAADLGTYAESWRHHFAGADTVLHFAGERALALRDTGAGSWDVGFGRYGILQAGGREGSPSLAAEPVFRGAGSSA